MTIAPHRSLRVRGNAVLLAVALVVAACTAEPRRDETEAFKGSNADLHERLADGAFARGELVAARENAREALRIDPARGDAARILAHAELLSGSPKEALIAARRATANAPDEPENWLLVADCAMLSGEREEASRALARASALGSVEADLASAGDSLARGDDTAIREILKATPEGRPALGLYVERLIGEGRTADALAVLDAALARDPDARDLRLTRARIMLETWGPSDDPSHEPAFANPEGAESAVEFDLLAAAADLRGGRPASAADRYRAVVRSDPTSPAARVGLGEALLATGDHDGALAAFESAGRLAPDDLDALLGQARVLLAAKRFADAFAPLERALMRGSDHLPARGLLVAAACGTGDLERARREALALRRIDPGGPLDLACRELVADLESDPR